MIHNFQNYKNIFYKIIVDVICCQKTVIIIKDKETLNNTKNKIFINLINILMQGKKN